MLLASLAHRGELTSAHPMYYQRIMETMAGIMLTGIKFHIHFIDFSDKEKAFKEVENLLEYYQYRLKQYLPISCKLMPNI